MIWLQFALIGAFAGFAAGYLGIGGGLLIVPALIVIFSQDPALSPVATHMAVATSMATMLVTSLASIAAHQRRSAILWQQVRLHTAGLLIGAVAGALLASRLDTQRLAQIFGVFALLAGLQLLLYKPAEGSRALPGRVSANIAGSFIGTVSSLVGIGGGSMTAPWLMWHGVQAQKSVATAAACGYPIALAGSVSFVVLGSGKVASGAALGYVNLPALAGITVMSVLFAPLGAAAVHKSPPHRVRQAFGVLLLIVAWSMMT